MVRPTFALALSLLAACSAPSTPVPARPAPAAALVPPVASAEVAASEEAATGGAAEELDEREAPPPEPEPPCTPLPAANKPKVTILRAPPLPGSAKASKITYPSVRTGNARVDGQVRAALEGLWRERRREFARSWREDRREAAKRGFEISQEISCEVTLATERVLGVDCNGLEEFGGAHPAKVDVTLNLELCVEGARPLPLSRLFRARSGYRKALLSAWSDALGPDLGEGKIDFSGCYPEDADPLGDFALMPRGIRFVTGNVPFVCGGLRGDVPLSTFRAFLRVDGPATVLWP
jgi:hypothetical protein